MKNLNYKQWQIEDIIFYVAKSRVRNMRLSIRNDGKPYAVYPYGIDDEEMRKFLLDHIEWTKKAMVNIAKKEELPIRMTISELKEKVSEYVIKYKALMDVNINRITFRKMNTIWGSCTKDKQTIRFSTEMIKCSDEFIEYIVVHELAHLIEANHSKRFWKIVEKYVPDYKRIKKRIPTNENVDN